MEGEEEKKEGEEITRLLEGENKNLRDREKRK